MGKKRANGEGTIVKRKDGTWQASLSIGYTEEGKRKRKTVYGRTQAEVREKLDELRQQLTTGTYSDTNMTVKVYLERWLSEKSRQAKASTMDSYNRLARGRVIPKIGRKKLDKLTPLDIQTMMGELSDDVGIRTANACRTLLFSAFKQAVRWQLVTRNPVEATDPLRTDSKEMRLWSTDEAVRFLDVARAHRLYAAFYLAMATGMRRGDLLSLRWQDVKESVLHVRQQLTFVHGEFVFTTPKTDKGTRRIAVSQDVLRVVENHRQRQESQRIELGELWPDTGLVFVSELGTPIHPRNFERTWHSLQKATRQVWRDAAEEQGDEEAVKRLDKSELMPRIDFTTSGTFTCRYWLNRVLTLRPLQSRRSC